MVRTSWIPNLFNFAPEILKNSEFNSLRNLLPYLRNKHVLNSGMNWYGFCMLKGNGVILPVKICTLQQVKGNFSPDFKALKFDSKGIEIVSKIQFKPA